MRVIWRILFYFQPKITNAICDCWIASVFLDFSRRPFVSIRTELFFSRCVAEDDKSLSIGFTEALLCALAFIPGPVVYGMLLGNIHSLITHMSCGRGRFYCCQYLLTYSMELSPSWEANKSSTSQEIPHILWNPKVHHRIHNSPPPVSVLSQIDLVNALPTHFSNFHFNIILSSTPEFSKWSPSLRFPYQNPVCTSTLLHTCQMLCPSQSYWFDHLNDLVRNTEHKVTCYVVFSTPPLPRSFYVQISSSAPYSPKLSAYVPRSMWATKFHTHTKQQARLQLCLS